MVVSCGESCNNFEIAAEETLSKAASMSRNVPRTYPFWAMRRLIRWTTLWKAVSVETPFLKAN